jgi:hypothetical protein
MEPDVGALATQQGAVDTSRPMILGRVTRDGREMLMLMMPDRTVSYAPAELMPGAEVGAPLSSTAAESLMAGAENLEEPLPGAPLPAPVPLSDDAVAARVAALETSNPPVRSDPERSEDQRFYNMSSPALDALAYADLSQLTQAPRYRLDPPGILRPRGGSGAQALQRLGIASLV